MEVRAEGLGHARVAMAAQGGWFLTGVDVWHSAAGPSGLGR